MPNNDGFADFISFKKFVSRTLIMVAYVLGAGLITISGIIMMIPRRIPYYGMTGGKILLGLITLVLGNIFWRIICEAGIIIFSIRDDVNKIEKHLQK